MIDPLPSRIVFDHRVEDREQFAHARSESELLGFPRSHQSGVERSQSWIASRRDQAGYVERRTHGSTTAPDKTFSLEGTAIASQRRHADESGDLFAVEKAQLRQATDEGATGDGSHTGKGPQQVLLGTPDGAGLNRPIEVGVDVARAALEPANVLDQVASNGRAGLFPAIRF